jgi:hypothetical protein
MMSQPEMELTTVRPKMTAEHLAEMIPLGKKTSSALLTLRQRATKAMSGRHHAPVAADHFEVDEHAESKSEFVEGAEPTRRDFSGRMRQR